MKSMPHFKELVYVEERTWPNIENKLNNRRSEQDKYKWADSPEHGPKGSRNT